MNPPPRPAGLYRFHRILIGTAAAFGLVLGGSAVSNLNRGGGAADWLLAATGFGASLGLLIYLRWFSRKTSRDNRS